MSSGITNTVGTAKEHATTGSGIAGDLIEQLRVRIGVATCVVFGHTVDWGPCRRCHRRARG